MMTRGFIPMPFLQGHLDGLCGIYAVINAIRIALGRREHLFTVEEWQHLFHALLLTVDDFGSTTTAAVCGLETKPLLKVLEAAARHMAEEHELKLSYHRVLKRKERPELGDLLLCLNSLAEEPNTAILLSLTGHLDHWTVLRHVGRTSLVLFDSSQFARVNIANCRMSYEPAASKKREHVIRPRAVLRVLVGPG